MGWTNMFKRKRTYLTNLPNVPGVAYRYPLPREMPYSVPLSVPPDIPPSPSGIANLPDVSGKLSDFGVFAYTSMEFITLPTERLPQLVADYVTHIETNTTARAGCECEWIMHPDDGDKPEDKRRYRRGAENLLCPVHTKEGFILGFFTWVGTHGD